MTGEALTLQERLEAVRIATARDLRPSAADAGALLQARARQLARPARTDHGDSDDDLEILLVNVGDERLAIPVAGIVAIARPAGIAPLPRAVAPVYGVTAWRGRPITVLSLGARTGPLTPDSRLVVLGSGARAALAVIVDAVDDVACTSRSSLAPAGPGPRHRYVLGVTSDGILVVDGNALLHPETLRT